MNGRYQCWRQNRISLLPAVWRDKIGLYYVVEHKLSLKQFFFSQKHYVQNEHRSVGKEDAQLFLRLLLLFYCLLFRKTKHNSKKLREYILASGFKNYKQRSSETTSGHWRSKSQHFANLRQLGYSVAWTISTVIFWLCTWSGATVLKFSTGHTPVIFRTWFHFWTNHWIATKRCTRRANCWKIKVLKDSGHTAKL